MDVDSLYQEIILDHYKHPRGAGLLPDSQGESHQVNPTCGDEVTVNIRIDADGRLRVGYEGQGCSISQASTSVMSELVDGMSVADTHAVEAAFLELMRSKGVGEPDADLLQDAVAFAGVSKYPARIKCALLPWMALRDAEVKAGIPTEGGSDE
jgi:nitrogen fixation NifU-like protein